MWAWDGPGGWMGWWMPIGMAFWLAVLVLLVWVASRAIGGHGQRTDDSPEQILKRRYARGEIEREEYERRLSDLRR